MFGSYLRDRRLEKGVTQRELAEFAGVSKPYISKLENGKEDPPSEEVCKKLATLLDVDPYIMILHAGKVPSEFQEIIQQDPDVFKYLKRKAKARAAQGGY